MAPGQSHIGVANDHRAGGRHPSRQSDVQEAVMSGVRELEVFTDSELLARQWNGEYKIKEDSLKVLFLLAAHLIRTTLATIRSDRDYPDRRTVGKIPATHDKQENRRTP